jgi:hypothetical protein
MENRRHLIALDLDGTLLTDMKLISDRTKQTIFKAVEQGHIVVIATGRPHGGSMEFYEALGLQTPMVNFNGAFVHHPRDHNWGVHHNPMPVGTAHKIIDACYELDVNNILAEVMDEVYLDQYNQEILEIFHALPDQSPFKIGNLKNNLTEDPTSVLIHPREDHISDLRNHLDDFHAELIEHRKWGAPWNIIEIVKKGMNKAVGLHKIAKYFDIPPERIIAFGDEDNDLEMIDYAGIGVAMGNAIDELKSIANHVTDTNEKDGVGQFLEEYLNLQAKSS